MWYGVVPEKMDCPRKDGLSQKRCIALEKMEIHCTRKDALSQKRCIGMVFVPEMMHYPRIDRFSPKRCIVPEKMSWLDCPRKYMGLGLGLGLGLPKPNCSRKDGLSQKRWIVPEKMDCPRKDGLSLIPIIANPMILTTGCLFWLVRTSKVG
jgi:hypothetical protein